MCERNAESHQKFEDLLAKARCGSRQAFEELINPFECVLRCRAQRGMGRRLRPKISESDIRQLTYLQSFENLSQFQGNSFDEFACWL